MVVEIDGSMRDEKTRKLERDLEKELGDDYIIDLKKHFLLKNPTQYADFIGNDVVEKFRTLKKEKRVRSEAGVYDSDVESDDEDTKQLLADAKLIEEKELEFKKKHELIRGTNKPRQSRLIGRKRERTMETMEKQFGALGGDINQNDMKHFGDAQIKQPSTKKMRIGKEPSLSAVGQPAPRDIQGVPDLETYDKTSKVRRKAQRPQNQDGRKGEDDRHISIKRPKHLFAGKRGMGKTDRC
ncbi:hypothetical protein QR680_007840 [Steinernema hermaphroditum]|uniref:NOG C-terminal domain-containing protein n=1 Tax=Steinernema hermaphroditum TaxID=289476 RepID=A0AA39IG03_9BILA|nr:hypothetical protein QR680_007840 [Steinernema hermaphroditum]